MATSSHISREVTATVKNSIKAYSLCSRLLFCMWDGTNYLNRVKREVSTNDLINK